MSGWLSGESFRTPGSMGRWSCRSLELFSLGLIVFCLLSAGPWATAVAEDEIVLHYEWEFKESQLSTIQWSWDFNISLQRLNSYKDFAVEKRRNYGRMITTRDDTLVEAAGEFHNASRRKGYDGEKEVSFVLSFIQSLDYTSDKVTTGYDEYPRFPLETLADRGGDCEDTSILFATLIILLEYDAVLFLIPGTVDEPGHMAVGVAGSDLSGTNVIHNGKEYYYAETTGSDWGIGDIPPEYLDAVVTVIEFTGEQYDPDEEGGSRNPVQYLMEEHPGLVLFFIFLLIAIVGLVLNSVIKKPRSRKPEYTQRRGEADDELWLTGRGSLDPRDDFFFSPHRRKEVSAAGNGKRLWSPLCPKCSEEQVYDPDSRRWTCERCRGIRFRPSSSTPHRYDDHGSERWDEWDY